MNKKKIIAWGLFLLWAFVIFFFSAQSGQSSNEMSNGALKVIENIIHIPITGEFFPFLIRKIAHFSEYFILGILSCHLVKQYRILKRKEYFLIFLFCVLYALSDEFHQMFVGGRSSQIFDVFIDSTGSFFGLVSNYFIFRIRERKNL